MRTQNIKSTPPTSRRVTHSPAHSTIRRLLASRPSPVVGHSCAVCHIPSTTNLISYVPATKFMSATNTLDPPSMCSGDIATPFVQWSNDPMILMSDAMPTQRIGTVLMHAASIFSTSFFKALDMRSNRRVTVSSLATALTLFVSVTLGSPRPTACSFSTASAASCTMDLRESISSIAATKRSFACLMSLSLCCSVNSRNLANLFDAASRSLRRVRNVTICSNKRL